MKAIIQVLLLLLHLSVQSTQGATDAAEAAIEFKALCRLTKLLETPVVKNLPDPKVDQDVLEIMKLNMSAAPESWREKFGDGSNTHDWAGTKGKYNSEPYATDWKTNWPGWLQAAKGIAPTDSNKEWLDRHPRPASAQIAAAQLKALAGYAKQLQEAYTDLYKIDITSRQEYAEVKLKEALTRTGAGKGGNFTTFAEQNTQERKDDDCKGGQAGKGVLYDMACLCVGTTTDSTKGCIGGTLNKAWSNQQRELGIAMKQLKQHCKQGYSQNVTATALMSAVTAVENLIGRHAKTTGTGDTLGGTDNGDCTGGNGKVCVKYNEYYSSAPATPKSEKVPWMTTIEEASTALTAAEKAKTEAVATAASIANLKATAEAVYAAAQIKQELTASDNQGATQSKHTIDCTNIKTNTTCKEKGCKWEENSSDKSKGTCKPKDGEGQTKEAGETPNAESKKCFEKKNQEDCKDGCKWDGKECKDSSILVNKHFALSVVSAAFVALLF